MIGLVRVDPSFVERVKKLGAFDITACYNCGNCTAICPLSSEGHEFPRKLIRYSILGMENKVISAPELWLCYY
ncbi:MAG: 4Fe-4S ferredoxin, partial [Thermoproteota archaeon]